MTKKRVDDLFFQFFCQKNSDGTKNLRLHGREMYERFGRRLNKHDMPKLASFLRKHQEVISLDLAYNDIGNMGVKILTKKFLDKENNLQFLNLLHCDIEPDGMKWLSSAKFLRLKSLRLVGNKLGMEGARFIGKLIENCPYLENLDIGETDQILESIESLLMVVEKSRLKSLNISRIIPSSFYSNCSNSTLADNLGILLKMNDSLEVLRVQKCEFDGHDVQLLLSGLYSHKNLLMLDLSANGIGNHGVEFLGHWLRTRPSLLVLKIPSNGISDIGAEALGTNLPFSRIRLLDLQNNKIGGHGLVAILSSLKKSTQIRMLYIWGNHLSPEGLDILAKMFKAEILNQEYIDVKVYELNGEKQAAFYPVNRFRHKEYSVLDYGFPPELRIIRNKIHDPLEKPRALVNFEFIERFPPIESNYASKREEKQM